MPQPTTLDAFIVSARPPPQPVYTSQEILDRDSRFVATIYAATSPAHAQVCIKHLRSVHTQNAASHYMSAWRCMELKHGCTGLSVDDFELREGSADDGERWGGEKILNAMRKQGILDAVVIVSRWYGGTMLGPARFTHIDACASEVCKEFKRQEDVKDALATLRTLDDVLAQLRAELAALTNTPSTSKPKETDYAAWIDTDLPKAHRLIRAREGAISSVKELIQKHRTCMCFITLASGGTLTARSTESAISRL